MAQLFSVFFDEVFEFLCAVHVKIISLTKRLSKPLSQYLQQRIGKVKWIDSHVQRRVMDSGAELVGSVENTIMPVSNASTPIDTVALLHDLLTMMMSGSARKKAHMTSAKSMPTFC